MKATKIAQTNSIQQDVFLIIKNALNRELGYFMDNASVDIKEQKYANGEDALMLTQTHADGSFNRAFINISETWGL